MTPRDPQDTPLPEQLRWRLRELRREQAPARDLWPDIAARLAAAPPRQRVDAMPTRFDVRRWAVPVTLAATVALAIGVVGWQQGRFDRHQAMPSTLAAAPPASPPSLLQREAAGMTRQYQAALGEIAGAPSSGTAALQPAFDELDRSAQQILAALERDPDSQLLLQQLHRTYSHRLALAQRAALS